MYVVEALMGLPLIEWRRFLHVDRNRNFRDLDKLHPKKLSSWHMKKFIMEKEIGKAVKYNHESVETYL